MENYEFYEEELYHHGIKGMRWGIRRYQNKDGSLTPAGQKHRSLVDMYRDHKVKVKRKQNLEKARVARAEKQKVEAEKKKAEEKRQQKLAKGKLSPKDMTEAELRSAITKKQLEEQYKSYTDNGASAAKRFMKTTMDRVVKPALIDAGERQLKNLLNTLGDEVISKTLKQGKQPDEYAILTRKRDLLKVKQDIRDLENPKVDTGALVRELENRSKLNYLQDKEYQQLKKESQKAEMRNKIKNPNHKMDEDRDQNNNGYDDLFEEEKR